MTQRTLIVGGMELLFRLGCLALPFILVALLAAGLALIIVREITILGFAGGIGLLVTANISSAVASPAGMGAFLAVYGAIQTWRWYRWRESEG